MNYNNTGYRSTTHANGFGNFTKSDVILYVTSEYGIFNRIKGNRKVSEERVAKILNSINKVGPLPVPLVVNEKYEVIDGQGRLEAFKRKGLPVHFEIVPGLSIDDCISMNINMTPWSLLDYVESYAEVGDVNFQRMLDLFRKYYVDNKLKNQMSMDILSTALFKMGTSPAKLIKDGNLIVTEQMYEDADKRLEFAWKIVDWINKNKIKLQGPTRRMVSALLYCYDYEQVDKDELISKIKTKFNQMQPWTDIYGCIQQLDYIYNYGRRGENIHIARFYEDDTSKKTSEEIQAH